MEAARDTFHHGDLDRCLVDAGAGLVEEVGVEAFSLREVARRLGVSATATYRHYEHKAALLAAIAGHGASELGTRMQRALGNQAERHQQQSTTADQQLRAMAFAYVEFAVDKPQTFRLMYGPSGLCRLEAAGAARPQPDPDAILSAVLDDLVDQGSLSVTRRRGAELHLWAAVHGFAHLAIDGPPALARPADRIAALDSLLSFIARGIELPTHPGPEA